MKKNYVQKDHTSLLHRDQSCRRLPKFERPPKFGSFRKIAQNKSKVIRADLLSLDLDLDFDDIFRFCNISVMVTFQF